MRIGTHDGTFHCDESLACYMLKLLPRFSNAEIVRSRKPEVWETCDILVDVGAIYDPEKGRYDHHQKGFFETFSENHQIKLSSAGLIYKHYGKEILREITKGSDAEIETLYVKIYDIFVQALDGIDNGIPQYDTTNPPRYHSNTDLSARVGKLNPLWNDTDQSTDERFQKAMKLAGTEFEESVKYYFFSWLPARSVVYESVLSRFNVDESGKIVVLSKFVPWSDHLHEIEIEMKLGTNILYCVYQSAPTDWRVQTVKVVSGSFDMRKPLPDAWKGLRDADLSKVSGVDNCVFVHMGAFIGGNTTKEGAIQMAKLAVRA